MGLRWAFDVESWQPTIDELALAIACIQPEESKRITRFVYQKDALLALAGRLLLRRAACGCLRIPWKELQLERTKEGKPFVINIVDQEYAFNISHHGNFTVLAAEPGSCVGVDIMTFEPPTPPETVHSLLNVMRPLLSMHEWTEINHSAYPLEYLMWVWTLKESYIKAIGSGLQTPLQLLEFHHILSPTDLKAHITTIMPPPHREAVLYIDGMRQSDWIFEQSYLDNNHCVAVCLASQGNDQVTRETQTRVNNTIEEKLCGMGQEEVKWNRFVRLDATQLLLGAVALQPLNWDMAKHILGRPKKHGGQ